MSNSIFSIPTVTNEPILEYKPESPEKKEVLAMIHKLKSEEIDVPMVINGKEVRTEIR